MCVNYAIWWAMVHLHAQNSLTNRNVTNVEGGIEQKNVDLNVPTIWFGTHERTSLEEE